MLKRHYTGARLISAALSVFALLLIGWIWAQSQLAQPPHENELNNMDDVVAASRAPCWPAEPLAPVCLPTGVFVQSVHFRTATDVNFTGYVWQRYPRRWPEHISPEMIERLTSGVIFPEEVDAANTADTLAYEATYDKYSLKGWYFDVTVRQSFDYSDYPLDTQPVWLRIWTAAVGSEGKIHLVPDFDAYTMIDSGTTASPRLPPLFGISDDIVGGGWTMNDVYFSYRRFAYDTTFGFERSTTEQQPELFFNVEMRRKFRNAFIINLVPLVIVALLLFSQVMMITRDEHRAAAFGSNTSGVVATNSSLFFVVLLAHIQVRQEFAGSELVYIEQFYLIMYCVIVLTALDAYLFAWRRQMEAAEQDDRWAKILFWPLTLWAMAMATVVQFRDILF